MPDAFADLEQNRFYSRVDFHPSTAHDHAQPNQHILLLKITNLGFHSIPNLDVDLTVRYDRERLRLLGRGPDANDAYISIGDLIVQGSSILSLRNLTRSDALLLFAGSGTFYETPRRYKPIEGLLRFRTVRRNSRKACTA